MRIINIAIILFILSAFAVGISLTEVSNQEIDSSINTVSSVIDNISLEVPKDSQLPNSKGIYKIIESGVKFVGTLGIESFRTGVYFGKDNPEYFTPEFIMKIIKLIITLLIISLLIKPVFYVLIFLVMVVMWILDLRKKRRLRNEIK